MEMISWFLLQVKKIRAPHRSPLLLDSSRVFLKDGRINEINIKCMQITQVAWRPTWNLGK